MPITWRARYDDFQWYLSSEHNWADLPAIGIQKIRIRFPNGHVMGVNGWDWYVLQRITTPKAGVRLTCWKSSTSNDINGNPLAEPNLSKGFRIDYYEDGTSSVEGAIVLEAASVVRSGIIPAMRKQGRWMTDRDARTVDVL